MLLFVTILVVACVILHLIWENRQFLSLAFKIPHPGVIPYLGDFAILGKHKFNVIQAFDLANKKYGDYFSMWASSLVVFVSRAEDMEILLTNPDCMDRGPTWEGVEEAFGGPTLITAEGEAAKKMKRSFYKDFTNCSQEVVFKNFEIAAENLLKDLESKEGHEFGVDDVLKTATNYSIGATAFLVDFDVRRELRASILKNVSEILQPMIHRGISPLHKNDFLYKNFLGGNKAFKIMLNTVPNMYAPWIEDRKREYKDYISKGEQVPNIYAYNLLNERPDMTTKETAIEWLALMAAALDTSAITATNALTMLAMHPEYQQLAYEEAMRVQQETKGQPLSDSVIAMYNFLALVIKETLRILPAVPILPRIVRSDLKFGEYVVPKGSTVYGSVLSLHRDPLYYKNPTVFDPYRFSPENIQKIPKYAYLPFGAGPRNCPGFKYGTQSAIVMVSSILRKYKIFTPYKSLGEIDKNTALSVTSHDITGSPIRIERR